MHEDASQSIGNDFFDFGGGNSRSRSVRSSFVNLILREQALSRTCASVLAFGIAITFGWRNTQASNLRGSGVVGFGALLEHRIFQQITAMTDRRVSHHRDV